VFDLRSDPRPDDKRPAGPKYASELVILNNMHDLNVAFRTPPTSPVRKAVHRVMLDFAKGMGIDKIPPREVTISEGDRQPARRVAIGDLIANPGKYHGKRVSVAGYYHVEEESSSLAVDEGMSGLLGYKRSVWRGWASSFADKANIADGNNVWQRVEGVFLKGPSGHMGLWPGEIVRLTRLQPEPRQAIPVTPLGRER
jgi:hypothetical protein